jgi:hypothetical protein
MKILPLAGVALALLLPAASATAEEPVATARAEPAAQPARADADAQAVGDWAREVMAGEPAQDAKAQPACPTATSDRAPHGEVWGAVGSHGYREVGGVVTQPLGKCASVTLAVSRSEGGGWAPRGR